MSKTESQQHTRIYSKACSLQVRQLVLIICRIDQSIMSHTFCRSGLGLIKLAPGKLTYDTYCMTYRVIPYYSYLQMVTLFLLT